MPIAHLLELTPQAQGCVFLGFSACGNFLCECAAAAPAMCTRFLTRCPRLPAAPSSPPHHTSLPVLSLQSPTALMPRYASSWRYGCCRHSQ